IAAVGGAGRADDGDITDHERPGAMQASEVRAGPLALDLVGDRPELFLRHARVGLILEPRHRLPLVVVANGTDEQGDAARLGALHGGVALVEAQRSIAQREQASGAHRLVHAWAPRSVASRAGTPWLSGSAGSRSA